MHHVVNSKGQKGDSKRERCCHKPTVDFPSASQQGVTEATTTGAHRLRSKSRAEGGAGLLQAHLAVTTTLVNWYVKAFINC